MRGYAAEMADAVNREAKGDGGGSSGAARTPELPLCFSSHERFSCLSLNFPAFCARPFQQAHLHYRDIMAPREMPSHATKEVHRLPCVLFIRACDASVVG